MMLENNAQVRRFGGCQIMANKGRNNQGETNVIMTTRGVTKP